MGHLARMEGERRAVDRPWTGIPRGSVKEADRERTDRKLYATRRHPMHEHDGELDDQPGRGQRWMDDCVDLHVCAVA